VTTRLESLLFELLDVCSCISRVCGHVFWLALLNLASLAHHQFDLFAWEHDSVQLVTREIWLGRLTGKLFLLLQFGILYSVHFFRFVVLK